MNSYKNDKLSLQIGNGYLIINGKKYMNSEISENSNLIVVNNEVEIDGKLLNLENGTLSKDKAGFKEKIIGLIIVFIIISLILINS